MPQFRDPQPCSPATSTQHQRRIQLALQEADAATADALWRLSDWATYSAMRNDLLEVLRSEHSEGLALRHLQFIGFINRHVRPRFNQPMSDEALFTAL